jgi:translation initiation factor 3 subunit B
MAKKKTLEELESDPEDEQEVHPVEDDEEPNFDDPEDFVDDISDEELLPDLMKQLPKESDGVDSVIVVDGVPSVGAERVDKLKNVIKKIFSKYGKVINEHYPIEDDKTKGYIFLEYENNTNAKEAVKMTNNYKLDKQHTFIVNLFSDFEKYESIPEVWEVPEPEAYKDQGNLKNWLLESDACDQYSVVHEGGNKVSIYTNTIPDVLEVESRGRWTESYVKWSPLGTYLTTFHGRGIALWGGQTFQQIAKFAHQGVQYLDFSPCEQYMVTFAPGSSAKGSDEPTALIIWETRTGAKKRAFHADRQVWPIFKWSHDDEYFARMSDDSTLSIYQTPSFGLLDKKSLKIPGMRDFSWSPTENILAYWVAEDKDVPARVMLLEIPSRNEVRVKNLFNVADCKMHWQKAGDYLCVKVDRYSKIIRKDREEMKYAGMYVNFELFHMREKQIPVDSVEIKENVQAFAWEPVGSKFAIIHGELQSLNVSFYGVKTGHTPILLKKYERKSANQLYWSPTGQFIVLAGLRQMNGILEYIDTADFTTMNTGEHFMCTDIEWDPTGRYVMTGVSWWGHKVDNAYWMWSFQGKILKRYQTEQFCQLLWRPRPATPLTAKALKEIKKNLKKYSVHYDTKDKLRMNKASQELIDKRRKKFDAFEQYREQKRQEFSDRHARRCELRRGTDTDVADFEGDELEEEVVEFLVKEEETIVE